MEYTMNTVGIVNYKVKTYKNAKEIAEENEGVVDEGGVQQMTQSLQTYQHFVIGITPIYILYIMQIQYTICFVNEGLRGG